LIDRKSKCRANIKPVIIWFYLPVVLVNRLDAVCGK